MGERNSEPQTLQAKMPAQSQSKAPMLMVGEYSLWSIHFTLLLLEPDFDFFQKHRPSRPSWSAFTIWGEGGIRGKCPSPAASEIHENLPLFSHRKKTSTFS